MSSVLVYIGSAAIALWGIGHLAATRPVLAGFAGLSGDGQRILLMEWIAEGLTLCFIGVVAAVAEYGGGGASPVASAVIWTCVGMLVGLALLSAFTGARTAIWPMRACPFVKTLVATLYVVGTLLH